MKNILVKKAVYLENYKIEIFFNDTASKVVDFESFLKKNSHPQFDKYKNIKNFVTFKIENGNLVWGENWDLIFPIYQLYKGKIQ